MHRRQARRAVAARVIAAFAAAVVSAAVMSPAGAEEAVRRTLPIYWDVNSDPRLVGERVGTHSIVADDAGVVMSVETSGLPEGRAYTVWLIFANNPGACRLGTGELRCSMADGFNDDVDMHAIYCDGFVSTGPDTAQAAACTWPANTLQDAPRKVFEGTGLLVDPRRAEYHAQLLDHGASDTARYGDEQTTTVDGGCARRVGSPPDPTGSPCHPVQGNHFPTRGRAGIG